MAGKIDAFRLWTEFTAESRGHLVGTCPFCAREGKFYVNVANMLWDCKRCGRSGDFRGFLRQVAERNVGGLTRGRLARLARERGLPEGAFAPWSVGYADGVYTMPVSDIRGRVVDVRRWRLGERMRATPGCTLGLLGCERVAARGTVYVAEGEGDAIALEWLLRSGGGSGSVVAVPGASVFRTEWLPLFEGRDVALCYDHDGPGEAGERRAWDVLQGTARSVRCLHWPSGLPEKYDVRDFVRRRLRRPRRAVRELEGLLRPYPRSGGEEARAIEPAVQGVSPEEAFGAFHKWLLLPDDDLLLVVLGAVLGNRIDPSSPIWLYLIGASGAGKSAVLSSLWGAPGIHCVSNLTPRSLASGAVAPGGADPSLIPRLNGKTLVVKDFGAILSGHSQDQRTIFGDLRDAYDGRFTKEFGTGVRRTYVSSFGLLAGCTPAIDGVTVDYGLGERFLKYRISPLDGEEQLAVMRRAADQADRGAQMDEELRTAMAGALSWEGRPESAPELTPAQRDDLIRHARWASYLRGVVLRDRYRHDEMLCRALQEEPTRVVVQLAKLARGIAWAQCADRVTEDAMRIARRVARDTPRDREADVVGCLAEGGAMTASEVARRTGYPRATVGRRLEDLRLLGIVRREARSWGLTDETRERWPESS